MTNRQIGELAVGIFAVYLFSTGLLHASALAMLIGRSWQGPGTAALATPVLAYVGMAWAFWSARKWIATRLFDIEEPIAPLYRAAGIAVRVLGLFLLFRAITAAGELLSQMVGPDFLPGLRGVLVGASVSSLIVTSILAATFIFRPEWLVDHLLVREDGASGDEAFVAVAFATAGIYTIATALAELTSIWFWYRGRADSGGAFWPANGFSLLERSLTLLAGMILLTGSQALARLWKRIRSMPLTEPAR